MPTQLFYTKNLPKTRPFLRRAEIRGDPGAAGGDGAEAAGQEIVHRVSFACLPLAGGGGEVEVGLNTKILGA